MKQLLLALLMIPCLGQTDKYAPTQLAWEKNNPQAFYWTQELRYQINQSLPDLEEADDIQEWCSTYHSMDTFGRVDVWATLFVSVAYYESSYDPENSYTESNGIDSLGLFQLSTPDDMPWCNHKTRADLFDPINNIKCAVPLMAGLISEDRTVAQGYNGATAKGAAKYWSTMRGGTYQGHRVQQIKNTVQKYCAR